jgi:chromosome segregation ATPase
MTPKQQTSPPRTEWETYCDECYYHMCRIRRQRDGLHELHNKNAARSKELLELCGTLRKELTAVTEQRDRLAEEITQLKSQLTQTRGAVTISRNGYVQELEQQRDRLAEALDDVMNSGDSTTMYRRAKVALQSLTNQNEI